MDNVSVTRYFYYAISREHAISLPLFMRVTQIRVADPQFAGDYPSNFLTRELIIYNAAVRLFHTACYDPSPPPPARVQIRFTCPRCF